MHLAAKASAIAASALAFHGTPVHNQLNSSSAWDWPVPGTSIDRNFVAPVDAYGPGHRGIDIAAHPGAVVEAVAVGTVTFVGEVAGVPVITVTHGRERSTYQPVTPTVEVGTAVEAGDELGTLMPGHARCSAAACLHLGRVAGETYLDPLALLRTARYRLIDPSGPIPPPVTTGTGPLAIPVPGPISSAFGSRVNPVTGVRSLHDGIDIAAACGTPIHASAEGIVVKTSTDGAFGNRIVVQHSPELSTSYSHLSRIRVSVGALVKSGQIVGDVGTTGRSTGCHLHFSVHQGDHAVDPVQLVWPNQARG